MHKWKLSSLKFKTPFLDADISFQDSDKSAAWDLYVELLTRVTTQPLSSDHGDEQAALDSVYSIFPTTRKILKHHGKECMNFTKISIVVLNQVIRPFTAKWHKVAGKKGFKDESTCKKFRQELSSLQVQIKKYAGALADIAQVEDLTELEEQKSEQSQT